MKVLVIICWIGVILGVGFGFLVLIGGMSTATGAPQEAVVICLALACAILPYCLARAMNEIWNANK